MINEKVPPINTEVHNSKIPKRFGTHANIREHQMASEELERLVAERTSSLREANVALHQSNQLLEQFAYAASHDLQEPLRKIKTFSSRLQKLNKGKLDETSEIYLSKITSSTARMETLIQAVLNYSLLEHVNSLFVKTDLNEILKNVLSDLDIIISEKGARVKSGHFPEIEAVPLQMNQLFCNIISNSLKFARNEVIPIITITSRILAEAEVSKSTLNPNTSYCEIIFADNGIGFNQEFAEDIFMIFQRLKAKTNYAGSGIGLALCRKIINIHHGEIYAEGKENGGASFHVILPMKHDKF